MKLFINEKYYLLNFFLFTTISNVTSQDAPLNINTTLITIVASDKLQNERIFTRRPPSPSQETSLTNAQAAVAAETTKSIYPVITLIIAQVENLPTPPA